MPMGWYESDELVCILADSGEFGKAEAVLNQGLAEGIFDETDGERLRRYVGDARKGVSI